MNLTTMLSEVRAAALVMGLAVAAPALALDMSGVPFLSERTKASVEQDYAVVSKGCRSSYAVAISKSGDWGPHCGSKLPEQDIVRVALERCEHTSQEACGLVVVQGSVVEFEESPVTISYPETFTASAIPFVSTRARNRLKRDYGNAPGRKALAITRQGAYGFATDEVSDASAERAALRFCEQHTRNRKRCFVYAVGSKVVFDRSTSIYPDR